jgi:glycosyltransferase involved in cell wall biosynthesis
MYLEELKKSELELPPIGVYFPVDAEEHSARWYQHFDIVDGVCVYTNFAKSVVLQTGSEKVYPYKIHVIPHGLDTSQFFPVDNNVARASIYPIERRNEFMNSFVILNANRNQPRKRIDITSWAFKEFQKDKDDVRIYLHMGITDQGVDIIELALRYGYSEKLVITANTATLPSVPVDRLNLIYNGTDVGLNTSEGEGWGLTNWEHAATGKLQMVPKSSAPEEIWKPGTALFLETQGRTMFPNINTVGKDVSVDSVVENLEWAYNDWKTNNSKEINEIARAGYELVTDEANSWKNVAKKFNNVIKGILR